VFIIIAHGLQERERKREKELDGPGLRELEAGFVTKNCG